MGNEAIEDSVAVAAARSGDASAFASLVEGYRRELRVHCYRMLGSFDEAEDLVQDTLLKAWRGRESFEGRSSYRAWLYRIATNACLDHLARHPRAPRLREPSPIATGALGPTPTEVPWLQPFPDRLLEPSAPRDSEPLATLVANETIELVFLAAIQHLPPRQRAVLILRDVLAWSAAETADLLELSVAAVKSALQRARATLREHLPARRSEWPATAEPTAQEQALLERFMRVHERADVKAFAALLSVDAKLTMPPLPFWFAGRDAVVAFAENAFGPSSPLYRAEWRGVPTRANRQLAVAGYIRLPGTAEYRAQVLNVLRIEDGKIAEITAFEPSVFAAFDLPPTLA